MVVRRTGCERVGIGAQSVHGDYSAGESVPTGIDGNAASIWRWGPPPVLCMDDGIPVLWNDDGGDGMGGDTHGDGDGSKSKSKSEERKGNEDEDDGGSGKGGRSIKRRMDDGPDAEVGGVYECGMEMDDECKLR
eukprot:gb/GECH01011181.1/.p1 GENE.gb/GECH01011181.1/~~gb/GECH01011181.1/.p1  ORF type:complete len:134 (+),score=30.61 gb/GECH01011181.1/:1-402(+)